MKLIRFVCAALLLTISAASAQIVQFSGAPPAGGGAQEFLAQKFSGPPVEVWGIKRENSSYAGNALKVQRNDNNAVTDIPFTDGKNASVSAFNTACNGTTCLLHTLYGQMGASDCVSPAKANMAQVFVHTDSLLAIQGAAGKYCQATSTVLKVATAHAFGMFYPGYVQDTGTDFRMFWAYTGTNFDASRYAFGLNPLDTFTEVVTRNADNAAPLQNQQTFGNANIGGTTGFHVWDILHNTATVRVDTVVAPYMGVTTAAITYPGTTGLTIGQSVSGGDAFLGMWRGLALYDSARADRDSISNFLVTDFGITKLPTTTTAGGYNWTPQYYPGWNNLTTDIFNIEWWQENGGYPWSLWFGQQSNPGTTTLYRFEVRPGDNDTMVNGMERSEMGGVYNGTIIQPGQDVEVFAQFYLEPGSDQNGDWADIFQVHYGFGEVVGSPDMWRIGLLGGTFNFATGENGNQTVHYSQAITRNNWYAVRWSVHIDSNRTTGTGDTLKIWFGNNGGTLTQVVNLTGSRIWNTGSFDGRLKNGIYRGFPNTNTGNLALVVANFQSSFTANAFSSFVTTQPTLPAP